MSKYQEYSLEELITYISRGITPKYTEEVNNSAIIINQKCIRDFQINFEPSRRNNLTQRIISEEKKVKLFDILINSTGVGTLGRVAQFLDDKIKEIISVDTHVTIVRPDIKKINPLFLGYLVKSKQSEIESFGIGSTGQTELSRDALKSIRFNVPTDRNRQKEIAEFFLQIDQKIQLNTQINQTLEQISQALFKSWFVDFDPVRAKVQALSDGMSLEQAELAAMQAISGKTPEELTALSQTQPERYAELVETAKAFPCEMVEVDGGEVPKGWGVKPIELILDRLKNKQKLRKEEISFEGTIPVFEQGTSILMGYHDKDAAFNASIDEPIFIFGDHTCITKLSTIPFSIYQNVIPLIGKNLPTYWVYCAIQNKQTFQEYRRHWAELIVKEVVVPDNINLCQCFSKKVKELFFKIDINHQENRTLIETRDLLLPRLLNGEI
ncbi:TPA: restriction endonuclease subunit S [Haemophilus influenzae]